MALRFSRMFIRNLSNKTQGGIYFVTIEKPQKQLTEEEWLDNNSLLHAHNIKKCDSDSTKSERKTIRVDLFDDEINYYTQKAEELTKKTG